MATKPKRATPKFDALLRFRVPLKARQELEDLAGRKMKNTAEVAREAIAAYLLEQEAITTGNGRGK